MVYIVLVQFLVGVLFAATPAAPEGRIFNEVSLGQKELENYSDRYDAVLNQDIYSGVLSFKDEDAKEEFFAPYLFNDSKNYAQFLSSELNSAISCTNEQFSKHYDDLRYAYRLITLSYMIEGQWQMKATSDKFRFQKGCQFDLKKWASQCSPQSDDMKKFIGRLQKYAPEYEDLLPVNYTVNDWSREVKAGLPVWYTQTRLANCKKGCTTQEIEMNFQRACQRDEEVMSLICSEKDDIFGLSNQRDAYYLIARSNIINTFNKDGEALGCLRRFSEVLAHKESHYPILKIIFPSLESFLIDKYQERFMQGRVFFYGASKEFEEKGLKEVFTAVKKDEVKPTIVLAEPKKEIKVEKKPEPVKEPPRQVVEQSTPKKEIDTMKLKSAFLQASEIRASQNLDRSDVDMTKLRYDYVFSLNMINNLSTQLKTFMTREALSEMLAFDKLGSVEGPVPLLFIKFLIDFQEHQGLWNLISVIGDKFYVKNDIDTKFKSQPELIHLKNDSSTKGQWQIVILKP